MPAERSHIGCVDDRVPYLVLNTQAVIHGLRRLLVANHAGQVLRTQSAPALREGIEVAVIKGGRVSDGRVADGAGERVILAGVVEPSPAAAQGCFAVAQEVICKTEARPKADERP